MLTQDQLEQLGVDVSAPAPAPAASANPDGALAYGVDQAQRMTGRGVQAIGGALRQAGADGVGGWIEGAGRGIVEQQDRDIAAGGFKPQYPGGFLDQPGVGAKLGWLGEGIATNAASSIPALAGAAGAAVLAPTAPALAAGALALGGGTSFLMNAGESAQEFDDKGVSNDAAAIGAGAVKTGLDLWGAKLAAAPFKAAGAKLAGGAATKAAERSATREVLGAAAGEGLAEGAQDTTDKAAAAVLGASYTPGEVATGFLDSALIGGVMGGGTAAAGRVAARLAPEKAQQPAPAMPDGVEPMSKEALDAARARMDADTARSEEARAMREGSAAAQENALVPYNEAGPWRRFSEAAGPGQTTNHGFRGGMLPGPAPDFIEGEFSDVTGQPQAPGFGGPGFEQQIRPRADGAAGAIGPWPSEPAPAAPVAPGAPTDLLATPAPILPPAGPLSAAVNAAAQQAQAAQPVLPMPTNAPVNAPAMTRGALPDVGQPAAPAPAASAPAPAPVLSAPDLPSLPTPVATDSQSMPGTARIPQPQPQEASHVEGQGQAETEALLSGAQSAGAAQAAAPVPIKTERAAQAAARRRSKATGQPHEAVAVDGGWQVRATDAAPGNPADVLEREMRRAHPNHRVSREMIEKQAAELVGMIERKDADALRERVVDRKTQAAWRKLFEHVTGVTLPPQISESGKAVDRWAGVTEEDRSARTKADIERAQQQKAADDLRSARSAANNTSVQLDGSGEGRKWADAIDYMIANGIDRLVIRGNKTYLTDANGRGYNISSGHPAYYAKLAAAAAEKSRPDNAGAQPATVSPAAPVQTDQTDPAASKEGQPLPKARKKLKQAVINERKDTLLTAVAKAGGLSREEAAAHGIDPADFRRPSGVFGRPIFRKAGGMSFDGMAELLHQYGYPVTDERGNYSPNVLLDRIGDELRGRSVRTPEGLDAQAQADQAQREHDRAMQEQDAADAYGMTDDPFEFSDAELEASGYADADDSTRRVAEIIAEAKTRIDSDIVEDIAERVATQTDARGATDEEFIAELEAALRGQETNDTAGQAQSNPDRPDAGSNAQGEEFTLGSYSESDIARREAEAVAAREREEKARKAAEDRARAERDRGQFELTGSDRPADANPRQSDLLDLTGRPERKPAAAQKPEPAAEAPRKSDVAEPAPAADQPVEPAAEPVKAADGYGASNTLFTAGAAEQARALLRKKLGQLSAGLDPEIVQAGITLAGYHIEAGARSFAAYTKAMIADLGEAVRPYLRSWYEGVRYYPGMDATGMTPAAEIDAPVSDAAAAHAPEPAKTRGAPKEPKTKPAIISGYSDQHPEWVKYWEEKSVGNTVYSNADEGIALMEGSSLLTGAPVYTAIMRNGELSARVDIDSYTGRDLTDAQRAELAKAKQRHVEFDAREHAARPDGPFKTGERFAHSDDIPAKVASVAADWLKLVGIDARVFLTTEHGTRGKSDQYGLYGPFAPIRSAAFSPEEGGSTRKLSNGDHYIVLSKQVLDNDTRWPETLAHEIGHVLEKVAYQQADVTTKNAIIGAYNRWITHQKTGGPGGGIVSMEDLVRNVRAASMAEAAIASARERGIDTGRPASEMSNAGYFSSFSEWFADQVSRWAVSSETPQSVVGKFFKAIANKLRKLYAAAAGKRYLPSDEMKAWLDARAAANPLQGAAEPQETADASGSSPDLARHRRDAGTGDGVGAQGVHAGTAGDGGPAGPRVRGTEEAWRRSADRSGVVDGETVDAGGAGHQWLSDGNEPAGPADGAAGRADTAGRDGAGDAGVPVDASARHGAVAAAEQAESRPLDLNAKRAAQAAAQGVPVRPADASGKPVWKVSGNTFAHKEVIKRAGGRFDGSDKTWRFTDGDPSDEIARYLKFSRETAPASPAARGMPAAQLRRLAANMARALGIDPADIVVHETTPDFLSGAGRVKGATDISTGAVHLVAGNLTGVDDALATLRHELIGHRGLRGVLRGAAWHNVMRATLAARGRDAAITRAMDAALREEFGARAGAEQATFDALDAQQRDLLAEETIARAAEADVRTPVWQRIVGMIMRGLRAVGLWRGAMNDTEMRALLRAAQRGLRRQGQGRAERDGGADGLRYRRTVFDATREAVVDAVRSPRTFNLLNRTVGTQFHKAWKSPQFRPVYDAVQDFLSDAQAFAYRASGKAPTLLPRLDGLRDVVQHLMPRTPDGRRVSRADTQAAATALFDGRIEDKLFSDADLRKRGLTDVQISLYREARAAVDASLDDVAAAVMGRIAGDHVGEQVLSRMKDDPAQAHAIVSRALAEIAAAEQKARDAALAEQKAAGDAAYEKAKGEALAAGKSAARAEVLAEKARDKAESAVDIPKLKATAAADLVKAEWDRIRSLKEKGYAPLMRFGDYFVRVTEKDARGREKVLARVHFETRREANIAERELRATYPDADVQLGVLAKEDSSMFDGLTPETLELFGDAIGLPAGPRSQAFQEYLQTAVANRSALKRMIHARKIAGYSADAERVLASFIISNGRYAARQYNLPRANEAWANIPEHMGDVRDEAAGLIQYVNNPRDEAAGVRSLLFAHFLGGSVASAITNMTQPVMMTLPYLSSIVGPVKAAQLLTRAVAITAGGVDRIADPGLRAAMQRAVADGVVAPQEIHQLYAEAIRNGLTDNRVVGRWLRSAATVWGAMFSVSEQINRRLTFAAGYMAAKGRGDSDAQAAAFAERAVQGTQGVYNKGNRPNWARGAVGATVFTFKQYSIAYMEFLSRLPRREKAMALGILALAAGIQGLPFAGDLDDGLDTLMQAFGYDWSTEEKKREFLRRWLSPGLADFAQYGLSTTGLPFDFQARLGLGNLVPGTELFKRSSTDRTRDVLEITGPAGSVVQQWMRAWDAFANTALAEGAVVSGGARALKEVLPVAVGNAMKAADMAGGYALDYRGRRVAPTTTGDAVSKAIGFQPASLAQQGRDARIAQERIALAKEERAAVSDLFARSRVEKDPELAMRARQRMANWNRRNPESRITVDAAQIRQRVKAMLETRDERLIRSAPRTMRRDIAEQING